MARKRFTAEQLIMKLREAEVGLDGVADRIVVPQKPGTTLTREKQSATRATRSFR